MKKEKYDIIKFGIPDQFGTVFMKGSINIPESELPVTVNFDKNKVIGMAHSFEQGETVKCSIETIYDNETPYNMTPGISFSSKKSRQDDNGGIIHEDITLRSVSFITEK